MPDYYAILWRALQKGEFESVRWRESVFDQTRQMLRDQLRNTRPPLSPTEIRHHTEALEAAVGAIRSATAGAEAQRSRSSSVRADDISATGEARSETGARRSLLTLISIVLAVVAVAAAAGGYAYVASRHGAAPPQPKIETQSAPSRPATTPANFHPRYSSA